MTGARMDVLGLMAAAEPLWQTACEDYSEGESVAIIRAQLELHRHRAGREPPSMTTLYKPVRIEYDEQAEALPIGTVGYDPPHLYAYIKRARNHWRETGHDVPLTDYEMLPFTAFVPIEAEEETEPGHYFYQTPGQTRLVTPWEEA